MRDRARDRTHTLLIHQAFTTPNDAGGTRHYELAQRVIANGDRFTVVASDFGYLSAKRTAGSLTGREEIVDGIRVLRVATSRSMHRGIAGQLVSHLTFATSSLIAGLRVRDVDVVLATTPPIFQAVTAWLVATVRRRPMVLEIRDLWPEFIIAMGKLRNPLAIAIARRLERFLYARADTFIVNSPAYVGYLEGKGIDRERITLIPNGVRPEMFADDADVASAAQAIRARYGLAGRFVAMYAGAMGPANDLDVLLDAAEKLRDDDTIHIVLVGDGKTRKQLEASARARSLANVTFAGPQSKSDMRSFLKAADVCVATLQNIAMFRMTYPNKVFDYLAAGRPVVLAIDGVIRDVVERAEAGLFVEPGDANALAGAIRELAHNPDRCRAMGRRGQAHARRYFNRRDHGELFTALLRRVAASRPLRQRDEPSYPGPGDITQAVEPRTIRADPDLSGSGTTISGMPSLNSSTARRAPSQEL
jgi:glycosyltransferase involved in cell wall biosynthesis